MSDNSKNWINAGRCHDHDKAPNAPLSCVVCNRILIERTIVHRLVTDLLEAGFALHVDYNDGEPGVYTADIDTVLSRLMACDEEWVVARHPNDRDRYPWIALVYGNSGYDVISDYKVSLEPYVAGANKLADDIEMGNVRPGTADGGAAR